MDDLPLSTNRAGFDEQPIGNTNKLEIAQYPPDFDPSKIQAKSQPLPIAKRLASKVWKIKKQALQELLRIVSEQNHNQFREYEAIIIKSMTDSNLQCQVLSTKILYNYLEKENSYEGDSKVIIKNVIQKLLTIQKEEIQTLGMDILFWLMDHSYQQLLMNELNEYLTNKNPKIIGSCMKVIQLLIHSYGIKKLGSLQIFTKHLKLIAEAAKPVAKIPTIQLFKEIYKWTGDACFSSFALHSEVKDQVIKWSKTYQMQPMQITRGLKKGEVGKKINPMQQEEQDNTPVDILHHFDGRWVDMVLQLTKWQQKKQHLEEFIKKTNVSSIVPRQTSQYITLIKRLCTQNNINLLQCGFKIVKNLCKGLKKAFAISCKSFLPYVYLKLKDNKAMIVDETLLTLKAMTNSITLEDLQQEITQGLKDKSPQMRLNTLKLLKDLSAKKQPKTTKILKTLLGNLVSLTNDSTSEVRDVALSVLCKIKEHHGMIFFEDKLETLPPKKVNQIRSTPTIGGRDQDSSKMQVEEVSINISKSNTNTVNQQKNVLGSNKENKMQQQNKPIKSPTSEPQISMSKFQKNVDIIQKKQSIQNLSSLPVIHEEKRYSIQERSNEQEMMDIRNEQWPMVPTPAHVLRLIRLFSKLGEPFQTLATPFKLKIYQFEILQNCQNTFMTENADLLLKWALWRIQIQNPQIIQKITSVVIHLIFLLKTSMSDSQTLLIMSILSNLLQSDFSRNQILRCINSSILQISEFLREKVFNFWISTLSQSNNLEFCDKILNLLKTTYQNLQFSCSEVVAMARVQPIVKNKGFMQFLLMKCNRQFLKVSGFKLEEAENTGFKWVLKQSESQFCPDVKVDERLSYFEIFKRNSHDAMQQIKHLQQNCPPSQLMTLHIKIMDTIMIPYLGQSLQSINIYNYFKLLTNRINIMCEPKVSQIDLITPQLRNLMRLVMFFLIDLSESRLDNKDQLIKTVNKIILVLLEKMPADHLLEVMTMLLKYAVKNNLVKKLTQLLMKCIQRCTQSPSFTVKSQKNVKLLFNFFISLMEEYKITDQDPFVKTIKSVFANLMANYKELCIEIVIEKLNQFEDKFISSQIELMFKNFIRGDSRINQMQNNSLLQNNQFGQNMSQKIDSRIMENNQSISNLSENSLSYPPKNTDSYHQQQMSIQNSIRETTNIKKKLQLNKPQMMKGVNNNTDLLGSDGKINILQERKKIQNYHGLYQSLEDLVRMKDEIAPGQQKQNNNRTKQNDDTII